MFLWSFSIETDFAPELWSEFLKSVGFNERLARVSMVALCELPADIRIQSHQHNRCLIESCATYVEAAAEWFFCWLWPFIVIVVFAFDGKLFVFDVVLWWLVKWSFDIFNNSSKTWNLASL